MSIVLVGAPGAGKSTVGSQLADLLGLSFVDVDQRIEAVLGKPIAEIFADEGEPYFRAAEQEATLELLGEADIIALGGGAVMDATIRSALAGHDVVWLKVSAAQASRRVGFNTARPLLLGNTRARLVKLLQERSVLYEEVATRVVDTDGRRPAEVAQLLAEEHRS